MEGAMSAVPDAELLRAVLSVAGVGGAIANLRVLDHSSNLVARVEVDGRRYVYREYRHPEDGERPAKERWLHGMLAERGVPVARILGLVDRGAEAAALLEWRPGVSLSEVPDPSAWRAYGACLRRAHEIAFDQCGEIVGTRVLAWDNWSDHMTADLTSRIDYLLAPYPLRDHRLVTVAVESCRRAIRHDTPKLVHNDASAWNVLVTPLKNDWECSAILDWEFARAGDPAWDLARLVFLRDGHYVIPGTFWDGYGSGPPQSLLAYELLIAAWKSEQLERAPDTVHEPVRVWLEDYLAELPSNLQRLADLN
jgi:aminoglycoside phosphotransferase (APT) family kinase protein